MSEEHRLRHAAILQRKLEIEAELTTTSQHVLLAKQNELEKRYGRTQAGFRAYLQFKTERLAKRAELIREKTVLDAELAHLKALYRTEQAEEQAIRQEKKRRGRPLGVVENEGRTLVFHDRFDQPCRLHAYEDKVPGDPLVRLELSGIGLSLTREAVEALIRHLWEALEHNHFGQ